VAQQQEPSSQDLTPIAPARPMPTGTLADYEADQAFLARIGIPSTIHYEGSDIPSKGVSKMAQSIPLGAVPNPGALFGNTVVPTQAMTGGGGVPSSTPTAGLSAQDLDDINSVMKSVYTPIDPNIIKAATTPTAGAGTPSMPSSMTNPLPDFQPMPMMPSSFSQGVVGRKAAHQRGIANAITGVTNAVGSIISREAEQKHEQIASSTKNLITMQQAIDQAKQVLSNNPKMDPKQAAALQQSIDRNTENMNRILSDKKLAKAISKGLDISFTDPSENKTPEHEAVASGKQQAQETMQQQFARQMPQQVGPNVQAIQQLQAQMAQQKAQAESAKVVFPYLAQLKRTQAAFGVEGMKEAAKAAIVNANWANKFSMQNRQFQFLGQMQGRKYQAEAQLLDRKYKDLAAAQKEIFDAKWDKEGLGKLFSSIEHQTDTTITAEEEHQRRLENDMSLNKIPRVKIPSNPDQATISALRAKYPEQVLEYNMQLQQSQTRLADLNRYKVDLGKQMASVGGLLDASGSDDDSDTGGERDLDSAYSWLNSSLTNPDATGGTGGAEAGDLNVGDQH